LSELFEAESDVVYLSLFVPVPVDGVFTYSYTPSLHEKKIEPSEVLKGRRASVVFGRRKVTGFIIAESSRKPDVEFKIKEIKDISDDEPFFGDREIEMAKWLASRYFCSSGEALSAILPGGSAAKRALAIDNEEAGDYSRHELSSSQQFAVDSVISDDAENKYFYLHGLTGTGKTEVYLRCAEYFLEKGESVIYLVPEIALTHQLVDEISARFGNKVAVLHSGVSPVKKFEEWKKIRNNQNMFVVGARSAVFAPVMKPGLIIIDEEHESSYKSGNTPRYHARQVSMYLSSVTGCRVLMGSATPSVEAYHLFSIKKFHKLSLTERLSGGKMPLLRVIDMQRETAPFSQPLIEEIKKVKESGGQSVLFLNRRGFSYFLHCKSCGYKMECPNCSVSLTYHRSKNRMSCHYCGYSHAPVDVCPDCGSLDIGYSGFGTEMIEKALSDIFPHYKISRLDTDSASNKGYLKKTIKEFREGKSDILLGTQMVAKGLNFPGVKLVGIILADTGMNLPDFRAAEKTFALITQVAGRAGRFSDDGRVFIQTYSPDSFVIKSAAAMDIEGFYSNEIDVRKQLHFPPFARLFRIVVRSASQSKCESEAMLISCGLEDCAEGDIFLLGPAEAPIFRIANNFRFQIILRSVSFDLIHRTVTRFFNTYKRNPDVYIEIDPDPVSLL
jgi:primosomal protein N' (replication factor Y)